jgi:hypothetical protein
MYSVVFERRSFCELQPEHALALGSRNVRSSSELTVCLVSNSPVCKIVNVSSTVFVISAKYCNHTAITGFVVPLPIAVAFGRARKSVGSRNFDVEKAIVIRRISTIQFGAAFPIGFRARM